MPLSPGSHLGPYEVLALLGAGGMGEVYRARDSRLGREVAIKVLPHDRVADESRRKRFIQEAKAASALNHPHIITIHEIESADGIDFLVMEYVRGKSLDALVPRQGMRIGEALRVAIAIADAIASAHAHDIVHRDLKPANVMVGTDGAVKVLDFGLAKLLTDDGDSDPHAQTRTEEALTKRGAVMGTLAYMSPEQASGEAVDVRSDVFSFGAMLYEMVTGVGPFAGKTPTDTLANVLSAQPKPPSALVPTLPRELERLILRCLRREPARRFQHMVDVKVDLQEIKEESDSGTAPPEIVARRRMSWAVAIGVPAIVALGVSAWLLRPRQAVGLPSMQLVPLTTLTGDEYEPSFSPDGEQVAFRWTEHPDKGDSDICVKIVGSSEVRRLTSGHGQNGNPSWSPDARQIAFVHYDPSLGQNRIHVMSALGGADLALGDFAVADSIEWSPDGRYIAAGVDPRAQPAGRWPAGIYVIPANGGEPRAISHEKAGQYSGGPAFSPDGHRLAYTACHVEDISFGCEVYVADLTADFTLSSAARQLAHEKGAIGKVAWSRDGKFVLYDTYPGPFISHLWRVDVEGDHSPERIELAGIGANSPATARSRDRLAFVVHRFDTDIYQFLPGRSPEPVLTSSFADMQPQFSPDGRRVAFSSARSAEMPEIWLASADGASVHQLTHGPGSWQGTPRWSPDGRQVVFDSRTDDGHWHIWVIEAEGGAPRRVTNAAGDQNMPWWSRDGAWIYFTADDGHSSGVWRASVDGGRSERVTRGGSVGWTAESADGRSLLYKAKDGDSPLLIMPVNGGPARQLVACVVNRGFAATAKGVYYVACDPNNSAPLHVMDPATGRDRVLGNLEDSFGELTVSPDERILYTRSKNPGADLMLIENFR
jgi:eukaryotic-like serine/threonine-protein kinase